MAEKRPKAGLALRDLATNIPTKKIREDSKKHDFSKYSTEKIEAPARKTSLIYKLNGRFIVDEESIPLEEQLYKEGYQKDYIRFLLEDEKKYVLKRDFLVPTVFTSSSRFVTVDILLKMQQYFKLPDNEYYMSVKLMDYSLLICTEPKEGILLAITSLWLVHKYCDNNIHISPNSILKFLRLVKMVNWMNERFTVEAILEMERKILLFTKFVIQIPDPSIYLEHFLRKLKLMQNKHIYHGSYFVCDCLSMFPKFSYVETSLIAATALYTTLVIMKEDTSRFLRMTQNVFQEENLKRYCVDATSKISYIHKMSEYREPFIKHSVMERLNICGVFERFILNCKNSNSSQIE